MRYFLFFVIIFIGSKSFAQFSKTDLYNRMLEKATTAYVQKKYTAAEKFYKRALEASPQEPNIYAVFGRFYMEQSRFLDAAYIYESANVKLVGSKQAFLLPWAQALYRSGNYEKAGAVLKSVVLPHNADPALREEMGNLQKSIDFGRINVYNTYKITPVNMGDSVNTLYDEYFPTFYPGDRTVIFTRKNNGIDDDFFQTQKDTCGEWKAAKDLGFPLNSSNPESALIRAFNGKYMVYQKCDNRSINGWERGGCDLYLSYANNDTSWSPPRPFGFTINTVGFEGMPSLSPDDSCLYFVSDRPGGFGGKDIWMSQFKNGLWHEPQNLGPKINTAKDETAPFIAADNKTLYFTSNGHIGYGGSDLYLSRKSLDCSWGYPLNLGIPINSGFEELSCTIGSDGKEMIFSSNRPGGKGGYDLYEVALPADLRPAYVNLIFGNVIDYTTKEPVKNANVKITNAQTNETILDIKSNKGDGTFFAALPKDVAYAFAVEKRDYLPLADTLTFDTLRHVDALTFALKPEGYQPGARDTALLLLDMKDSSLANSDTLCLKINRALMPFSGKILMVEVNYFSDTVEKEDNLDNPVIACLYKIGLSAEHLVIKPWKAAPEADLKKDYIGRNGTVLLKLQYLE